MQGVNPGQAKTREERNRKIYKLWRDGISIRQLAQVFNLNFSYIGKICKKIESQRKEVN